MAEDFAASIEDYLIGLAGSLQQAQRQLSELRLPGDGTRPAVSYQLPKLDFELKLALEVSEQRASPGGNGISMRGRLLNAMGSNRQVAEAASVIRGSFVAVPLSGGKSPPVLSTELQRVSPVQLTIIAKLETVSGEPLQGVDVHFNTDRTLASELNPGIKPPPDTQPLHAVLPTLANGRAINIIDAAGEPAGSRIPVTIDALGQSATVVFVVRADEADEPDQTDEPLLEA